MNEDTTMILKSQYTRAILWWVTAGCFLALFLFAGLFVAQLAASVIAVYLLAVA